MITRYYSVLEVREIVETKTDYLRSNWNVFDLVQSGVVWAVVVCRIASVDAAIINMLFGVRGGSGGCRVCLFCWCFLLTLLPLAP